MANKKHNPLVALLLTIVVFGKASAGISPVLAGYIWDVNGNYDLALIGATVLLIVGVIIALTLPKFEDVAATDIGAKLMNTLDRRPTDLDEHRGDVL